MLMTIAALVAFLCRLSMVALFLPFSALDKVINFDAATGQAAQAVSSRALARAMILVGLFVEVVMSAGILLGIADRAAAFVLAGYCAVTALLWKPFWRQPDFRLSGPSHGREMFWDFFKNLAVAGGFLALVCGPTAGGVQRFLADPFGSTHPYAAAEIHP